VSGTRFQSELGTLGAHLERALRGFGQRAAVLGDESSGKSAFVRAFAARAENDAAWQIGRGACDEMAGRGDPYRPLLDALTALCLQSGGAQIVSHLRLHAPTWLAELTPVLQPGELAAQRRITSGVTSLRLHRELDAVLVAIARQKPLLLVLEDLQWSDEGTLDWLAGLEQPIAAPIFVLTTHTSSDAGIDLGLTLSLEPDEDRDASESIARLGDRDRRVLEGAAVMGISFYGAEIATVLEFPRTEVESVLTELLAAGTLVRDADGGIYRFSSRALRAQILDELPVQRNRRLLRRVARHLETSLGESAPDRSPELAVRYERAYDVASAVRSYYAAALICRRRGRHNIAHAHLLRALALLPGMPDSTERNTWEALLHAAAGGELAAERGLGDDEVDDCYERALLLAENMQASKQLFTILWRIWVFYFHRGPMARAHDIAARLSAVARALDDPSLELSAHHAFWSTALVLGDVRDVLRYTDQGMALCGAGLDGAVAITSGCTLHDAHIGNHHAAVCAGFCGAWARALAGHREDAKRAVDDAIAHARDFGHPFSLAMALVQSSGALTACGDAVNVRRYADEGAAIASEHGFAVFQAWAGIYGGWAAARLGETREGLGAMYGGLDMLRDTGLWLFRPYQLALTAELELKNEMYDAAARSLDEAFTIAEGVGDRLAAAELHRLRGEHTIATARTPDKLAGAERDLRAGLDIATATGAEGIRARAARSLDRLHIAPTGRKGGTSGRVRRVTELQDRRRSRSNRE
jgi:hypothetical protein